MAKLRTLVELVVALISITVPGWAAVGQRVLYTFQGGTDGAYSDSGLTFDSSGNLYGTTQAGGGSTLCVNGCGVVFELTPSSGGRSETVLYAFQGGTDGSTPTGSLLIDGGGNLYGTATNGGIGNGTVFELSPGPNGSWTESTLYTFQGHADGAGPTSGVIMDKLGDLYGTTWEDGDLVCECGTVFELSKAGGMWTKTTLYSFQGGKGDGSSSQAGLTMDGTGNLYGVTNRGGTDGRGTIYEIYPSSGNWSEKILWMFTRFTTGWYPNSSLIFDSRGDLLGTARGGRYQSGEVFALVPSSDGNWTESVVFSFNSEDGAQLSSGAPALDSSGALYGTSQGSGRYNSGTVYRLKRGSSGLVSEAFYSFCSQTGCPDGQGPFAGITLDSAGNVYGTTYVGGLGYGVVYEITP